MTQEQELFTIISSMILNKVYCKLDENYCKEHYNERFKNSLFRVQGIQMLDSGGYMILLECMDDLSGRYIIYNIFHIKPYLRAVSSMTKEEEKEYFNDVVKIDSWFPMADYISWLNTHHFDYYNLIGKNLAIEAPEKMYK